MRREIDLKTKLRKGSGNPIDRLTDIASRLSCELRI